MKSLLLPPLSALYGAVTRTHLSLYQRGTLRTVKLERPVISVGNITAGGTGKTPLVEWVAKTLAREGKRVCILTRGYRRKNPRAQVVVSDGQSIMATPAEAGDEPFLLANNLLGSAAVICNADRVRAGRYAIEIFGSECFVLDDGFQHFRLARDLNIVTIDATNPWGGGRLLPYGRLREPISGLSRADCVVLTRCDQAADVTHIRDLSPVFESTMQVVRPPQVEGPLAAFCAVGNPESFFEQVRKHGYELVFEKAFTDHHWYTQYDINNLIKAANESGAKSLITTAKDAVKLHSLSFSLPLHVLEVEIAIKNEAALVELIRAAAA